ncbi:MAG TPA: LON peptidase substrate-binding domain-containing protein [Planctomycetaceae bacterium]|nr:LON peptidase substrate-binding domain-containing protein [Planctomycetaceae bacterium]
MTDAGFLDPALSDFSGLAPLFPLPNVVLFPYAVLPLHIFEPRYRQMTADALAGEGYLAMALRRSAGPEEPSDGQPAIHDVVGLGKIIAHERLPDGRYYLFLRGLARARVLREVESDRLYRVGKLKLCPETTPELPVDECERRCQTLMQFGRKLLPKSDLDDVFRHALAMPVPLAAVCDILAAALPLPAPVLQTLQDELRADLRSAHLLQLLRHLQGDSRPDPQLTFPPTFSPN